MNRIASDFLYQDTSYMQLLAGIKEDDDNGYILRILSNAITSCVKSGLTKKQRMYLEMYYFENMNIPQIAKTLGVNKSTVSRSLSASKVKIRRQLQFIALQ